MLEFAYYKMFFLIVFICSAALSAVNVNAMGLEKRPFRFMDSSGNEIESYCIVPLYVKSHGIGWGAEATGRKYSSERYLMWPAIVKKGDKINLRTVPQKGFVFLSFVVSYGEAFTPSELLIVKKGYLPILWNKYIDPTKTTTVNMVKGNGEDILNIVWAEKYNQNDLKRIFNLREDVSIVNNYSNIDREFIRKCYYVDTAN